MIKESKKVGVIRNELEVVESPINGTIRVVWTLGLGTHIQVDNLTQSGGLINDIWRTTFNKIRDRRVASSLVLGLGGGTVAGHIRNYWPQAEITGVDIDPLMVEMGRKYLGLKGVEVVISDASDFIKKGIEKNYDLILVDTYLGREFPGKFEQEKFLLAVKALLSPGGIAVFNRLYSDGHRKGTIEFGEKLELVFQEVKRVYPAANQVFLCYN